MPSVECLFRSAADEVFNGDRQVMRRERIHSQGTLPTGCASMRGGHSVKLCGIQVGGSYRVGSPSSRCHPGSRPRRRRGTCIAADRRSPVSWYLRLSSVRSSLRDAQQRSGGSADEGAAAVRHESLVRGRCRGLAPRVGRVAADGRRGIPLPTGRASVRPLRFPGRSRHQHDLSRCRYGSRQPFRCAGGRGRRRKSFPRSDNNCRGGRDPGDDQSARSACP